MTENTPSENKTGMGELAAEQDAANWDIRWDIAYPWLEAMVRNHAGLENGTEITLGARPEYFTTTAPNGGEASFVIFDVLVDDIVKGEVAISEGNDDKWALGTRREAA